MGKRFHVEFTNTPFLRTSNTAAHPSRLNWRAEIILSRNQKAIKDKRILDLASHDGRFSWACLELGASHVTGVEGRRQLVESATENLIGLGYKPDNFTFIQGDIFDYLQEIETKEFDTVLCLGVFYHTVRQNELLNQMKRIQPAYFMLDTYVARGFFRDNPIGYGAKFRHFARIPVVFKNLAVDLVSPDRGKPCLVFETESHIIEGATIDTTDLIAWPTKTYIELALHAYGFSFEQLHWNKKDIMNWTTIKDYKAGHRVSYIAWPL